MIALSDLHHICPTTPESRLQLFIDALNLATVEFEIAETPEREAHFLAQMAEETQAFTRLSENLNYSASGLLNKFPGHFTAQEAADYARQPERIANRVYANRMGNSDEASGDGWKYRGRGAGITGRNNYAQCGDVLGLDLVSNPDALAEPGAACRSFGWFWSVNGLNQLADQDNLDAISDIINRGRRTKAIGDANGYADRRAYLKRAKEVLL